MKKIGIFLFFILSSLAFGYINIYPLYFDQRIDGMGGIKDFILTNTTSKTVRYQIHILNENRGLDMSSWTEIYPRTLTLKPGEKGEVKMFIKAPKGSLVGEYSTILNIKELGIPTEEKRDKKIDVFTNLKIKLYGYVGKLDSSISLENFKLIKENSKFHFVGKLKNESLRRIKLEIILADSNEKNGMLISEIKLKKGEEIDLSNLKILDISRIEDSRLNTIYIYEKGSGKFLKKERIAK